ncbi:hypothetical protein FOF62_00495 [Lactobacillus jensenii]|nr:hypothetical protein FOF62_00495 [Lactobacillus jensenii]TVV16251.1 hypothetical protein FOF63_00425 [Lactobacillus jensenii]
MLQEVVSLDYGMDIDTEKTARIVERFLTHDLERYLRYAGKHRLDLASPEADITGISGSNGNAQEIKLLRNLEAQAIVKAVDLTLLNCSNSSRTPVQTILVELYVKEKSNWAVAQMVGYSSSRFREIKRYALCEFADRFDHWQVVAKVGKFIDLHCYK